MELLHSLSDAVQSFAASPYATWFLFAIAFVESSFFPIPPDTLLIPLSLANPASAIFYALIATIASTLGGMFGFFLGVRGGRPILNRFAKPETINTIKDYYNRYDIWAIGIAAFTPIPYKVFTISAGVFGLDFKRFVLASIVGRGARFFLVGAAIFLFGPKIKAFLDDYFEVTIIAFTALLIGSFFAFRFVMRRLKPKDAKGTTENK